MVGCRTCDGTVAGAAVWPFNAGFEMGQHDVLVSFFCGESSSSSISISSSESSLFSRLLSRVDSTSLSLCRFNLTEEFDAVGGTKLGSSLRRVAYDLVFA